MYTVLIGLVVVLLAIWGFVKLSRNRKFDKLCNDIVEGNLDTESTSKDTMKDISKAETNLGKQSEQNIKEANKLKKESSNINEFLGKKSAGVDNDDEAEKKEEC